jgi:23S rRNA (pseudouridine1915-N3)-methyltransferase
MKIIIIATGKQRGYVGEDTVLEYTSRLMHYVPVSWMYIQGSNIADESRAMMKLISDQAYIVVLDDKGKSMSSPKLAEFIEKRMQESIKDLIFIIGGAFGVSDEVKKRAQYIWSLSELTFPHFRMN